MVRAKEPFTMNAFIACKRSAGVLDVRVAEKAKELDGKIKLVPVLVQGARVYISKQTPNALNSSLTRKGASIEIMSMARGA